MPTPTPCRRVPSRSWSRSGAADYVRAFLYGALGATGLIAATVVLYAVKCRLGINVMSGPSPLHDVFVAMRAFGLV